MKFRFPGTDVTIRLFETVQTTDSQYAVVDCGVEYKHGGVDSLAVGGSFYSAKEAIAKLNDKKDAESSEAPAAA